MLGFIAPACGFMWGGQYSVVEICTSQGIEQHIVADNTNPSQPDHKTADEQCEFCFQNINLGNYLLNTHDITTLYFDIRTKIRFTRQNIITDNFSTLPLARGPPVLS